MKANLCQLHEGRVLITRGASPVGTPRPQTCILSSDLSSWHDSWRGTILAGGAVPSDVIRGGGGTDLSGGAERESRQPVRLSRPFPWALFASASVFPPTVFSLQCRSEWGHGIGHPIGHPQTPMCDQANPGALPPCQTRAHSCGDYGPVGRQGIETYPLESCRKAVAAERPSDTSK